MLLLLLMQAINLGCEGAFAFSQVVFASVGGFDASATHVNHGRLSANCECADRSRRLFSCFLRSVD